MIKVYENKFEKDAEVARKDKEIGIKDKITIPVYDGYRLSDCKKEKQRIRSMYQRGIITRLDMLKEILSVEVRIEELNRIRDKYSRNKEKD